MRSVVSKDRNPEAMTKRGRVYLLAAFLSHAAVGAFILCFPRQFAAAAFIPIVNTLPMPAWGCMFVVSGLLCGAAAWLRQANLARVGLVASAATLGACTIGLWIGIIGVWLSGHTVSPISVIFMSTIVAYDLIVCTQPLRSPFETLRGRLAGAS